MRLEPHPPYISPTAVEARHWGATYALYRVCASMFAMMKPDIIEHVVFASFAMAYSSIVFSLLVLAITGTNWLWSIKEFQTI